FSHRILHINVDMMLDGSCTMPQVTKLWDGGWDLRMLVGYVKDLLKRPDTRLLPSNIREKYGNLPGLPAGYENDYGVDDNDLEEEAKRKLEEGTGVEKADEKFVNPFELEKPVYPVELSKPEHDLRSGGANSSSNGGFLDRAFNLFNERPAKFKAQAVDFCKRECKEIGENSNGDFVEEGAIIVC
ncbi:hypothetical protein TrRE_jg9851, partial [Triparma retinervis]